MIYITGANGWLGLNLIEVIKSGKAKEWGLNDQNIRAFILKGTSVKKIKRISNDIEIFEGDLSDRKDIDSFLKDSKDSYLFHTAGIIHPKRVKEFYNINRDNTKKLLEVAGEAKVKKVIIVSSNSPCGCNPNNNHLFNEDSQYNPYMNYGKSKMEMEIIAKRLFNEGITNSVIIRAPWFYGKFQPARQKLFFKMIENGSVPLVGDGNNVRSMVFLENLCQGMILAATSNISDGKTYWIADKKSYSMNEIIDTIEKILIYDFNIQCKKSRIKLPSFIGDFAELMDYMIQLVGFYNQKIHVLSEMNKNIAASIEKAQQELNYQPKYNLKTGMKICIEDLDS